MKYPVTDEAMICIRMHSGFVGLKLIMNNLLSFDGAIICYALYMSLCRFSHI